METEAFMSRDVGCRGRRSPGGGSERGFTLIELMVVIAIIAIIAAIAIPNLLAARKAANEKSVIGALRAVLAAQIIYKDRDMDGDGRHSYARLLPRLGLMKLIDPEIAAGEKYGYRFEFVNTNRNTWHMRATCMQPGKAGDNGYWVDDTGVIRICVDNFADQTDPPL